VCEELETQQRVTDTDVVSPSETVSYESVGTIIAIAALAMLSVGAGGLIWYIWRGQRSKRAVSKFRQSQNGRKDGSFRPSPLG
jgi:hypothetical protein